MAADKEQARILLESEMSRLSESLWCAGWSMGCEYIFWCGVLDGKHPQLKWLADIAGGWWVWPHDEDQQFVPMQDWLRLFAEWMQTRKKVAPQ